MSTLKRPEVIFLLAAVIGIVLWVFLRPSESQTTTGSGSTVTSSSSGIASPKGDRSEALEVLKRTLERDYSNARLVLRLKLTNSTAEPQLLVPPFVRLTDSSGATIPPFFLALNKPPTLASGTTDKVELSFWLEESHLAGPLWLVVEDDTIEIKDDNVFDLDGVENQSPKTFSDTNWD